MFHSELFGDFRGLPVKRKRGAPASQIDDLQIAPPEPPSPAGSQCLHSCLFCCKSGRKSLKNVRLALGVRDFTIRKNPELEASSVPLDGLPYSRNFAQIHTRAKDHNSAPLVVMVSRPCLTPLVEISASAIFCTTAALPFRINTSRQLS